MAKADNGETEEKKDTEEKKKSPVLLIVIILLVLIILGGAAAGYFLFIAPKDKDASGESTAAVVQSSTAQSVQRAAAPSAGQAAGAMGPIKQMDPFIVNLTDAQGTRYLKVTLQFEMSNAELGMEIDNRMPQICDKIIMILASKSFDDVATVAGKRALKRAIINGVNKHLVTGQVIRVYFSEFVVQ